VLDSADTFLDAQPSDVRAVKRFRLCKARRDPEETLDHAAE